MSDAVWGGIIGVVGTLLGGVLAWLVERDRRGHEAGTRWLADRRSLYARLMTEARHLEEALLLRIRMLWLEATGHAAKSGRAPTNTEFEQAYGEADLMASAMVQSAMRAYYLAVMSLGLHRWAPPPEDGDLPLDPDSDQYESLVVHVEAAREVLQEAIRRELQVTIPPRPPWYRRLSGSR